MSYQPIGGQMNGFTEGVVAFAILLCAVAIYLMRP